MLAVRGHTASVRPPPKGSPVRAGSGHGQLTWRLRCSRRNRWEPLKRDNDASKAPARVSDNDASKAPARVSDNDASKAPARVLHQPVRGPSNARFRWWAHTGSVAPHCWHQCVGPSLPHCHWPRCQCLTARSSFCLQIALWCPAAAEAGAWAQCPAHCRGAWATRRADCVTACSLFSRRRAPLPCRPVRPLLLLLSQCSHPTLPSFPALQHSSKRTAGARGSRVWVLKRCSLCV